MSIVKKTRAKFRVIIYDLDNGKSITLSLTNGYKTKEALANKLKQVL